MKNDIDEWNDFLNEFDNSILNIYKKHENSFDEYGIHGRRHISRSIVFSEFMSRFYTKELGKDIDFKAIRYAVSFHDSGRQGNGIDVWENDSQKNCFKYLMNDSDYDNHSDYDETKCKYISSLISKNLTNDINHNIVYDSDVLDIMRPCCGHGEIENFRRSELRFLGPKDNFANCHLYDEIREELIIDAWKLIEYTEDNEMLFNTKENNQLYYMLNIVDKNKLNFNILHKYF